MPLCQCSDTCEGTIWSFITTPSNTTAALPSDTETANACDSIGDELQSPEAVSVKRKVTCTGFEPTVETPLPSCSHEGTARAPWYECVLLSCVSTTSIGMSPIYETSLLAAAGEADSLVAPADW